MGDARALDGVEGVERKGWGGSGAGVPRSCLNCGESTVGCASQSGGADEEDVLIDGRILVTVMLEESEIRGTVALRFVSLQPRLHVCPCSRGLALLAPWPPLSPGSCEHIPDGPHCSPPDSSHPSLLVSPVSNSLDFQLIATVG